jgi:hypothetical protein
MRRSCASARTRGMKRQKTFCSGTRPARSASMTRSSRSTTLRRTGEVQEGTRPKGLGTRTPTQRGGRTGRRNQVASLWGLLGACGHKRGYTIPENGLMWEPLRVSRATERETQRRARPVARERRPQPRRGRGPCSAHTRTQPRATDRKKKSRPRGINLFLTILSQSACNNNLHS